MNERKWSVVYGAWALAEAVAVLCFCTSRHLHAVQAVLFAATVGLVLTAETLGRRDFLRRLRALLPEESPALQGGGVEAARAALRCQEALPEEGRALARAYRTLPWLDTCLLGFTGVLLLAV